ncbi:MAG: hypothetical protein JST89_17130 [Cyanobacteria bacterium SZAS-4]|nr:hypothetical protein [Cyanobacteria bacterium SZAS-4]
MQVQVKKIPVVAEDESSLRSATPPGKLEWSLAALVGIVVAAAIYGSVAFHYFNPPAGYFFSGAVQFDQQYYMVLARAVFDFGNGLVYSNPFSLHPTEFYYSHLFILGLGWLYQLTKIDISVLFHAAGVVFTVTTFVSLFAFVASIETSRKWRTWMFLFCALGGGAGWLSAVLTRTREMAVGAPLTDMSENALNALLQRGEWLDSISQSSIFPNEAYYHTIMFIGLALLAKKRIGSFAICLAVMWWSHPFYGVELTAIVCTLVLLTCVSSPANTFATIKRYSICAVPALMGLGYYLGFLNTVPEHRDLVELWKTFNCKVTLKSYPAHYHVFLLLPPLLVLSNRSRARWLLHSEDGRFLTAFVLAVFALMNHNWLLPPTQPAHFSRGYLLVGLILLSFKLLQQLPKASLPGKFFSSNVVLACWLLFTIPDNVIGIYKWAFNLTGYHPVTTKATSWMPAELAAVRDYLQSTKEKAPLIASKLQFQYMEQYLMRTTGSRCYLSHVATPSFAERTADMIRYMGGNDPGFLDRYDVDYLLMDAKDESHHINDPRIKLVVRGKDFAFYKVLPVKS